MPWANSHHDLKLNRFSLTSVSENILLKKIVAKEKLLVNAVIGKLKKQL